MFFYPNQGRIVSNSTKKEKEKDATNNIFYCSFFHLAHSNNQFRFLRKTHHKYIIIFVVWYILCHEDFKRDLFPCAINCNLSHLLYFPCLYFSFEMVFFWLPCYALHIPCTLLELYDLKTWEYECWHSFLRLRSETKVCVIIHTYLLLLILLLSVQGDYIVWLNTVV